MRVNSILNLLIFLSALLITISAIGQNKNNKEAVPFNERHKHLFKDNLNKTKGEAFVSQPASDVPFGKYDKIFYNGKKTEELTKNIYENRNKNIRDYLLIFFLTIVVGVIFFTLFNIYKKEINNSRNDDIKINLRKKSSIPSILEQLHQLDKLKTQGTITTEEFKTLKERLLNS
jgi:hypothetical protein